MKKIIREAFSHNDQKKPLELPLTLRIARPHEVPFDHMALNRIKKSESAHIVEGYTLHFQPENSEHKNLGFEFYSKININNSRLWELFSELSNLMPNEIALISGHIDDEELTYGKYSKKGNILNFIYKFKNEITKDTYLKLGLIFHSDDQLVEIFIDDTKHIKFWGSNEVHFTDTLKKFNLENIEHLEFIADFPKVRFPLITIEEEAINTDQLLELLKNEYK